jgi:hypothetical protein
MMVTQRGADTRFEPIATVMLGSRLILPRCISGAHTVIAPKPELSPL